MKTMMKKTAAFLAALSMLLPVTAQAKTVEFTLNDTEMSVMSDELVTEKSDLPAFPFIANNRTMIPVRAVSENFGANVSWDGETKTVSIASEGKDIKLVIGSETAYVNGAEVALDVAPTISGDITFVPVRFVTENLGYYVYFASSTGSVLISDHAPLAYANGIPVSYEEVLGLHIIYQSQGYSNADEAFVTTAQNVIIADAASKAGYALNDEQKNEIKAICDTDSYPMLLRGQYALILEKDYTRSVYMSALAEEHKEENRAAYETDYLCAKHILVMGTDETAKQKAEEIYQKAIAPDADFDSLVAQYGEDPGMTANPDGYVFTDGEMVQAFENGTKELEIGSISKPVLTEYGYHIILRLPLPELSAEIETAIVWNKHIVPLITTAVVE